MNNRFDPLAQIGVLALAVVVLLVLVGGGRDDNGSAVADADVPAADVVESDAADSDNSEAVAAADTSLTVDGDAANGETLFVSNGCTACHNTTSDDTLVGPGLLTIADRAGSRVEGMSAVEYIQHSIREPSAFIVEGFPPAMPPFGSLSEQDLNDLTAYLLSLSPSGGEVASAADASEAATDSDTSAATTTTIEFEPDRLTTSNLQVSLSVPLNWQTDDNPVNEVVQMINTSGDMLVGILYNPSVFFDIYQPPEGVNALQMMELMVAQGFGDNIIYDDPIVETINGQEMAWTQGRSVDPATGTVGHRIIAVIGPDRPNMLVVFGSALQDSPDPLRETLFAVTESIEFIGWEN